MLRLYRCLLYFYPADYRREFGDEMAAVYLQARNVTAGGRVTAGATFYAREIVGLISGAVRGHVRRLVGWGDWVPSRRFDMRPQFRFPRSTVFLMCAILAGVVLAIEKARIVVQMKEGLPHGTTAVWDPMLWSLLLALALVLAAVASIWGILFALRRTGMQRLDQVHTWPEQR